jgi:hypothetical protein
MVHRILFILRTLLVCIGVFCILTRIVTVFVHEPASDKIYSRLDRLQKKLNELHQPALSRHVQFIRLVSAALLSVFTTVFGETLISLQSVAVTICYGFAAVSLGATLLIRYGLHQWNNDFLWLGLFSITAGTFPVTFKRMFKTPEQGYTIWITVLLTLTVTQVISPLVGVVQEFSFTPHAFLLSDREC